MTSLFVNCLEILSGSSYSLAAMYIAWLSYNTLTSVGFVAGLPKFGEYVIKSDAIAALSQASSLIIPSILITSPVRVVVIVFCWVNAELDKVIINRSEERRVGK